MKSLIFIAFTMLSSICFSQTIDIPDRNFERALIQEGIDTDKTLNGQVLVQDVQSVSFLDLYNKKIKCLKGIEAFTSLTYLDCRNNYISDLDLTKNISLHTLYADVNDVSKNNLEINSANWFGN
ncbi:leucine-rich repeat domain-containing protein [Hyunsoonleella aestuarii]|uniref:Leucine-rich repeat domain-containing protein n=1 Tax=Hyunsoonleella aestuarii TaxID=912802 RepID=A0ABP8EDD1_9FLAO|nr:leucine-rich repeat domain-containing protein [Hyunsoonleella aestuarii]